MTAGQHQPWTRPGPPKPSLQKTQPHHHQNISRSPNLSRHAHTHGFVDSSPSFAASTALSIHCTTGRTSIRATISTQQESGAGQRTCATAGGTIRTYGGRTYGDERTRAREQGQAKSREGALNGEREKRAFQEAQYRTGVVTKSRGGGDNFMRHAGGCVCPPGHARVRKCRGRVLGGGGGRRRVVRGSWGRGREGGGGRGAGGRGVWGGGLPYRKYSDITNI